MDAYKWVSKELQYFQNEEVAAIARVKTAKENLVKARRELAEAQELLIGVRGCVAEIAWEKEYLEEHGRLP
jgi:uncharacterized protein (DUF3084 family)